MNISYLTPPSQPLPRSRLKSAGAWSTTLRKSRNSSRQTDAEMNRLSFRGLGPPRQNKGPVPFGAEPFCFSFRDASTVRSQCFHRACTVVPSRDLKHDPTVCPLQLPYTLGNALVEFKRHVRRAKIHRTAGLIELSHTALFSSATPTAVHERE